MHQVHLLSTRLGGMQFALEKREWLAVAPHSRREFQRDRIRQAVELIRS